MQIADLNIDHLAAATPIVSSSALYGAILDRPYDYELARHAIGLTDREYTEAIDDIMDGRVTYGALPHHVDAMAGRKRDGRVYALRNVELRGANMGYIIPLKDGAIVYVPTKCGNLSVSRRAPLCVIGRTKARPRVGRVAGPVVALRPPLALIALPPMTVAAPGEGSRVTGESWATPAPWHDAPSPATSAPRPWWAALAGIIAWGVTRNPSPATATAMPCSSGSNEYGGCSR